MFELKGNRLMVTLPQGCTQQVIIDRGAAEIEALISTRALDGLDVVLDGRITTGLALMLGHKLAHICHSVGIFVPAEKADAIAIRH
jgi:hypothetical protein